MIHSLTLDDEGTMDQAGRREVGEPRRFDPSVNNSENVADRFAYMNIGEATKLVMGTFRDHFVALAREIESKLPPGRYRAMALTHLEDAATNVNKGLSRAPGADQ